MTGSNNTCKIQKELDAKYRLSGSCWILIVHLAELKVLLLTEPLNVLLCKVLRGSSVGALSALE